MKTIQIIIAFILLCTNAIWAQEMGNMNYQYKVQLPANPINIPLVNTNDIVLSIKGLYNIKADAYVAIFSLTQAGKTAAEVNQLIEERIGAVRQICDAKKEVSMFVDMISFVPVFEYDVVKKIFSKKTYNEVPKGFELKKNIHIRYKDPNFLNDLLASCAEVEIYDLVRVDYFSDSLEQKKRELMNKAKAMLDEKLKNKASIMDISLDDFDKTMADGYKVVFPVEMYNSYQAYASNSLQKGESGSVQQAPKPTTFYYKPYFDKDFDYVFNPTIFEPVIQVMYEVKVKYSPKPKDAPVVAKEVKPIIQKEIQIQKEVIIVTQTGEMKSISMGGK